MDGVVLGPLCWESLGIEGVTYQVLEHSKTCEPEVVEGPHPFAPLIRDPELDRRERELRQEPDRLQEQLRLQSPFCENLARLLNQLRTVHAGVPERLDGLRRMIDDASAAETGGLVIPLPSTCPVDAETYLAPDSSALMDLQYPPCPPGDPCRGLGDALASILSRIQSLQAHADVAYGDAKAEVDNWVAWADWRGSLELMHDMYSLVDEAIGFVDEVLSPLTGLLEDVVEEVKSAIMEAARRYLTDEACARYPQACQMLEAAESAEELIGTVREIMAQARSTGSLSPAFLVQMVQAMAQQVANVTGRALEEWESYARTMAAMIQEACESYLCLRCAMEWLLDLEDEILALCEACLDCLREDIASVEREIAEAKAEQRAAAEARQAYWQEQQVQISTAIGQVGQHLDPSWYDACCQPSPFTLTIPGESACAQELEDALKVALGDRACFLEFHCTIDCQYDSDGAVSSAAVNCTYDFPIAERRPCCCVPWERYERPIGTEPDPGQPGKPVCHPPVPGSMSPDPDGWSVEGLDASGEPIASSHRRPFGPGVVTAPRPIPRVPPSPKACLCSATANINRIPLTAGGPTLLWQVGTPANVASTGGCGPECTAGSTSISVLPPVISPLVPGGTGFAPLPISVTASTIGYDFPREGVYTITVAQSCEDGQQCTATYQVEAIAPPGPVARPPGVDPWDPTVCLACSSNDCLSLAYRTADEPPSMPALMRFVPVVAGSCLHLELTSRCHWECEGDRTVRWEFTRPDGMLDALEAADLYEIDYSFDEPGAYELCVIEMVSCDGGAQRFENWWRFEATERR